MIGTRVVTGLVLVGALVATHWCAYQTGNSRGKNAVLVATQTETIRKLQERVSANAALADGYRIQAEQENRKHEQELADVRALAKRNAGKRVPIVAAQFCGPAASAEASTAGGTGSTDPGTAFLPEPFAADLRQLAAYADEITAAYRTLRERAAACFE